MERTPNCYLTADTVLIVENEILLVRRKNEPFRGSWCFPGGFVDPGEKVEDGALRELMEETGVTGVKVEQFGAYGDPGRDPRGRTVSFVYWSRLHRKPEVKANDDAMEAGWFSLEQLPPLAFDHGKIAQDIRRRLRAMGR
jgi:8-oxo-dGTP diphosphatase